MGALRRRQFLQSGLALAGVGVLAGCRLLPSTEPSRAKLARLGFLSLSGPDAPTVSTYTAALRHGLSELGYVEGQHFTIESRFAEGSVDRLPGLATELIGIPVDVLITGGTQVTQAAKQVTDAIPIVVPLAADPVGTGLVASLARPGGNVTGLSQIDPQLTGKRQELLKEAVPGLSRVAVLWNPANPSNASEWRQTQLAAQALSLQLQSLEVGAVSELVNTLEAASGGHAEALMVFSDPVTDSQRTRIVELAAQRRLPAMYSTRLYIEAGGLMAYGADFADLYRRAASYVDKILKGAKPADLPVEQPTRFEFIINLKTAQALGLTIPQSTLQQATELIQ